MLRSVALGGVAAAVLSSGCCWRPFCGSSGPALFNPPAAPLFPRLHPFYSVHPAGLPAGGPVGLPVGGAGGMPGGGPDCPGCAGGGMSLGAGPVAGYPTGVQIGGHPGGGYPLAGAVGGGHPGGGYPIAGPTTVNPPPGLLAAGPQFSPMYFGQPNGAMPPAGSTALPAPRQAGEPPSAMPMNK